jgi:hypothetical protein
MTTKRSNAVAVLRGEGVTNHVADIVGNESGALA